MRALSLLRSKLKAAEAPAKGAHLSPELIAAFAERRLPATDRNRALDHLGVCPGCRAILSLQNRPPHRKQWVPVSAAAAAAACLALGLIELRPKPPSKAPITHAADGHSNLNYVPQLVSAFSKPLDWRVNRSRHPYILESSGDQGLTWHLDPRLPSEPDKVASNGKVVWVADLHGTVLESLDNGLTWSLLQKNEPIRSK